MTTITTRAGKGSALTYEEADANFTNLKTDVESLQGNITAANAAIVTANTAMKGYVDAVTTAWTSNAGAQANQIAGANASIVTANTALKAYTDAQITTTQSWVTGANAAIATANTALKGYTDNQITTANTALKSYVDTQDTSITTAWTANAGAQAMQIAGANAAIITANSAVVSFVNTVNSAMASNVAGANASIVTANTAMRGYVDAQITTTQSWVTGANASIVTANTAMKSYVDAVTTAWTANAGAQADQITGANVAIVTANTALKAYTDNQITTANTALKAYTDNQITTANTALKAYVDVQDSAVTSAWTANAGAQANQIAGANASITTANTAMRGYVDAQITTTQSWVTGANASITTANTAMKSYVDAQDSSITSAWTSNAGVQADAITALQSNAGAQAQQITGANVTIAGIDANLGSFQTYANATFGTSSYANATVASYLPVYGGNILAGNTDIPYTAGTRNRGPLAIGGNLNHYDSGVVASFQGNEATYLYTSLQNSNTGNTAYSSYAVNDGTHTYYGELGINSGTYDYAAAGYPNNAFSKPYATFIQSTGANLAVGTYSNHAISFVVNGQTTTADAMTIANTGLVSVSGNLSVGTTATVGNISSTSGYFWANGAVYSTGSGTSFTGNLLGSTLTDSVNGRIVANASPQQNITQVGSYTQGVVVNTPPSYTGANLNSQNQSVSLVINGNVNLLTTYANATLRTTNGTTAYLGVTATSSNTSMNPSDRVRAFTGALDINLNGKNWGLLSAASNALTPIVTNGQTQNLYGTGQVGQTVAIGSAINITPVNGSISAQYVTSNFPSITYSTAGGGYTASNISTARLYSGAMTATANLTITNAIALHTYSGWVSSNVSLVSNAYTVLNEDSRSVIQTNGNLTVTGALATTGNLRLTGYNSPAKRYANPSSGNVAVSGTSMQSFQQIALAGNVGITASSNGFDTVYDFKVEQDGTGGRTLTWYDNSGSANTQVYGFLNPIPNSATIARAILSDGGLWTVNYANPTAPANTAANWRLYPGQAGATVAVTDAGGKIAYWDTTNSRWSYIFDNSAV